MHKLFLLPHTGVPEEHICLLKEIEQTLIYAASILNFSLFILTLLLFKIIIQFMQRNKYISILLRYVFLHINVYY